MGQKVHPTGFRLGFNKTWRSRWYSEKDYAKLLHEDVALKKELKKRFAHAGVSRVDVERAANKLKISIFTSRPGIIIGRKGQEVDKLVGDRGDVLAASPFRAIAHVREKDRAQRGVQLLGNPGLRSAAVGAVGAGEDAVPGAGGGVRADVPGRGSAEVAEGVPAAVLHQPVQALVPAGRPEGGFDQPVAPR